MQTNWSVRSSDETKSQSLHGLFHPNSVLVVGASDDPFRIGGRPISYLDRAGYTGEIVGVNPHYDRVQGHRCYPSVDAVPDVPDVALIAVGGKRAVEAVESCAAIGASFAVVYAAGFAEAGSSGQELESELATVAGNTSMRILGPNTLGVLCPDARFVGSFASAFECSDELRAGRVGFVSQSGALGAFIYAQSRKEGIDFRYWVSTGNETDLEFSDFIDFMANDSGVSVIAGYLEGVPDGRRLASSLVRARASGKEVILLKTGRSEIGRSATASHTASIAGPDAVYDALFKDLGVIRAHDPQELLEFCRMATRPRQNDNKSVAIITISGGVGAWMSDTFDSNGISLAKLNGQTQSRIREALPVFARSENPVDLTGQILNEPGLLRACIDAVLSQKDIGLLVIALGLQEKLGEKLAEDIVVATDEHRNKPGYTDCVVAWMAAPVGSLSILRESGIPTFTDFGRCVRSISALLSRSEIENDEPKSAFQSSTDLIGTSSSSLPDGSGPLDEPTSKEVLEKWGIPFPKGVVARSIDESVSAAQGIDYPVVLKGISANIIHKSDSGLIRTGLRSDQDVRTSAGQILATMRSEEPRLLVEEMVSPGIEVFVGVSVDEVFGPVLAFGAGGVLIHLLDDQAIKPLPVTRTDAESMITETRVGKLLLGYRGSKPLNIESLIDIILSLGSFALSNQDRLTSAELNPVIVDSSHCTAVDAVIVRRTTDTQEED